MNKPDENEEHVISDREKRAWRNGKKRVQRERPNLSIAQRIEFLKLFARMAPIAEYERTLDLRGIDVEYYRKLLNVESPDEARRLARKLQKDNTDLRETTILEETQRVRDAEAIAQQRLEELEAKRTNREPKVRDANAVKKADAERQRRFAKQQQEVTVPAKVWQLPLEGTLSQRQEQIDRFRRELVNHGFSFVRRKYNATNAQIKYEADHLKLNINWDTVRR